MSLGSFLAGRPTPPRYRWTIERRHAEGGDWAPVGGTDTDAGAREELVAPDFPLDRGDLVRLRSPGGSITGFWVVTAQGLRDVGVVPLSLGHEFEWEAAWEGPWSNARAMLTGARWLDRSTVVPLLCDLVGLTLDLLPQGDERVAKALQIARRRARRGQQGKAPVEATIASIEAAAEAFQDDGEDTPATHVARAAGHVLRALWAESFWSLGDATVVALTRALQGAAEADLVRDWDPPLLRAVRDAYRTTAPDSSGADVPLAAATEVIDREFAAAVRTRLPLSALLLARAGDPSPWPPGG